MLVFVFAISSAVLCSQASSTYKLKSDAAQGKRTFASNCAACHGLDARGSERAPNLVDRANGPRLSDSKLFQVIHDGIPAGGMPSFRSIGPSQISAIVRYLRALQGTSKSAQLPGNPERGKQLFFSKGECSHCHMINGDGGFIASELSHYATDRTVEQVRTAITNPAGNVFPVVRLATVITHSGEKYVGRVRNEDNFSLQMQLPDGTFQSIRRSDLETLEYAKQPMMPAEYGSSLTSTELNDLISYLMSVAEVTGAETRKKAGTEEPIDEPD
jgi:cytochrome c oxidase cbb3-type subunit III